MVWVWRQGRSGRDKIKIDTAERHISPGNFDLDRIAKHPVTTSQRVVEADAFGDGGLALAELSSRDKALNGVFERDKDAARRHARNRALVYLTNAAVHILGLVAVLHFPLTPHSSSLLLAGLHAGTGCKLGIILDQAILRGPNRHIGQDTVDGKVRVTADRAGKVGVIFEHKAVVAERFGAVTCLHHA